MTNKIVAWFEKELTDVEPEVILWAKNFLSGITPIIKKAADDAVLAAVTVPGTGAVKAAAALATAAADLATQGIPVAEADLKAAIQIAYNALPGSVRNGEAAPAVVNAANAEVDSLAKEGASALGASASTGTAA